MKAFTTPVKNMVSENRTLITVCWTEMRGPPLTENWNSGDRCAAYVTRNGMLSDKLYLSDKAIFEFFMIVRIRTFYFWVTTPCSVVGGCHITAVCLQ